MRSFSKMLLVVLAMLGAGHQAMAEPAAVPDTDVSLTLPTTVEERPLNVYFAARGGKVVAGGAHGYNTALHTIDGSGLTVTADTLKGNLKITVTPDAYLPQDKKPLVLEFSIDSTINKSGVKGTYQGTVNGKEVKAEFMGRLVPPASKLKQAQVSLIMWGGLAEGPPYLRDAQLDFSLINNAASRAKLAWRKKDRFHWTAVVDSIEAQIEGSKLVGTVEAKVTSGGEVKGGSYTFKLDGEVIANFMGGKVKVLLDGKERKEVHFTGKLVEPQYDR